MSAVYTWGCDQGNLGPDNGELLRWVDFDNRPIKHVAAGRAGTAVLTDASDGTSDAFPEDGELFLFGQFGRTGVAVKTSSKEFISDKILGVSCGQGCVAFYTEKNEIWAWGPYLCEDPDPAIIHRFPKDVQIKQIACGGMHCLVLTNQGVYAWGRNNQGQMGISDRGEDRMLHSGAVYHKQLLPIVGLKNKNIVQLAAGGYHSLALTDAGEVYCFGAGGYGQLGTGNKNNQPLPTLALELASKKINFIAAGPSHSIAISTDGKAYLFGRTESKQCNCSAPENACVVPVEVSVKDDFFVYGAAAHSCTYLVTVRGIIYDYGTLWHRIENVMVGKDSGVFKDKIVHQIWCGHYHAVAVVGEMKVNISPSTYLASMQTAFTDTLHKDMTLKTPREEKKAHGVVLSSLSEVVAQKAQLDKSRVDITEELKQLSSEQVEMLLKYCYGISSEVKPADLTALLNAAKNLKLPQLAHDTQDGSFVVISTDSLSSALSKTFNAQDERFSDITFTFNNSPDKIHAHKIILSSRCSYFRGLFDLGMKESKQDTMHISEWSAESFRVMLAFLYSDQLHGVTGENVLEVLQLATTYLIQRLIDKCEEFIVDNMTLDTAVDLYIFADVIQAKQIQRGCQFLVHRKVPKDELTKLPNYDKMTQAQRDVFTKEQSDSKITDVQIEMTSYKFIEKINKDEEELNPYPRPNNNNNNDGHGKQGDKKRCIVS